MSAKTKPGVVDIVTTVTPTDGPGERGTPEPRQDAQPKPTAKLDMVTIIGCLTVVALAVARIHINKAAGRRRLLP